MNEFTLYSPTSRVPDPRLMLPGVGESIHKKHKVPFYDNCRADYARKFNYVIISGNLQKKGAYGKLTNLYDEIQGHFLFSNKLSIYFRLTAFDMASVSRLLRICKWISFTKQKGSEINVFWETSFENTEVRELGHDFSDFCGFPFVIREA